MSRSSRSSHSPGPDDLDDVPAGAAEDRLQLLDDLAVAAHRSVQALEVAVDDEGEVVEPLARGDAQPAQRLRLVHLAVADEGPHPRAAGVGQAARGEVAVEAGLVDRGQRAEAHATPSGTARSRASAAGAGYEGARCRRQRLAAEVVELLLGQPALEEGAGVDPGRRVALEEDLVAGTPRPSRGRSG